MRGAGPGPRDGRENRPAALIAKLAASWRSVGPLAHLVEPRPWVRDDGSAWEAAYQPVRGALGGTGSLRSRRPEDATACESRWLGDRLDLEVGEREAKWSAAALRDFARVWKLMTPANQGRLLRALVAAVRVKEETGLVEVELVNFAADAGSKEAA